MVKPMYEAGINVLAGSDCGPYNSYVYPGESLQAELAWLVNAGLTPQQALSCSVLNGPKFFGLSGSYGSIAAGKVADLLVLGSNPLDDIKNISDINTVIAKGKVYGKASLKSLIPR
jgi:imidazolonepropionase-like amidohydrolase